MVDSFISYWSWDGRGKLKIGANDSAPFTFFGCHAEGMTIQDFFYEIEISFHWSQPRLNLN